MNISLKNVAILALGMFATQVSFAQGEFRFGLKGQANMGWLAGTNKTIENDGVKLGFGYGIMGDYYFRDNYGVSGEVLLSTVKTQFNLTSDQIFNDDTSNTVLNNLNYAYKVQYLELPISMKFRTNEIGNITYWGNFGFSPGFALNSRASITSSSLPDIIKEEDPTNYNVNDKEGDPFTVNDFDDKVSLIRFPLIIGGGIEYRMAGSTSLQAGIRYANAFTNMLQKDGTVKANNNYFALSAGILF